MLEGLMKAIDIIDKEQEYAKEVNPIMYLGMEQVKKLIKKEIQDQIKKEFKPMVEGLIKALEIIDKEQEYAKEVNPIMYLGMEQIKKLINKEIQKHLKQ